MFEDVPKSRPLWDWGHEHELSRSARLVILIGSALAAWGVVLGVSWGVVQLFRSLA
jgi:hypothetical protein